MPLSISYILTAVSLFSFVAIANGSPTGANEATSLVRRARRQVIHPLSQYTDIALADVTIGGQKLRLFVDTASSWTWVKRTSLANANLGESGGKFVQEYYEDGDVAKGEKYTTTITLASALEAEDQVIGVAEEYGEDDANHEWDGIMGLNINTVEDESYPPNVFETLANAGQISRSIGIFYKPEDDDGQPELVWGGYNAHKIKGGLFYAPMTTNAFAKAEMNWGVDAAIKYKGQTIQKVSAAYLDTGSSTIDLPSKAYRRFADATGAVRKGNTTSMTISPEKYAAMDDLVIVINGKEWPLIPNALKKVGDLDDDGDVQMGLRQNDEVVLQVHEIDEKETAFGFGLGVPFFQRYYVHLDDGKQRIGIGRTQYTQSQSN